MKCLVLLPTFNEAGNIEWILKEIWKNAPQVDVLVIDDNSPDGTAALVEKLMKKEARLSLLKRAGKEGLGRAYLHGFQMALAGADVDRIIMMDADGSHDPTYLSKMIELSQVNDVVIGSRYIRGGGVMGWERWRQFLSRCGNFYCRLVTRMPFRDCTAGFLLINRKMLTCSEIKNINLTGYAFLMELKYVLWRASARIVESPIIFKNRREGESKLSSHIMREGLVAPWRMIMKKSNRPQKLIYISPMRYPSEKAGSLFSMKSCEVFADQGLTVELWAPTRFNKLSHLDPYEYHQVKNNFRIRKILALDLMFWLPGTIVFKFISWTFALSAFLRALWEPTAIFYSHEPFALFLISLINRKTIYEIHDFPGPQKIYRQLFQKLGGVVTTNNWKKEQLLKRFNLIADRVLVVPNAVELGKFSLDISKTEARRRLNLPVEEAIILYTGHLYSWKGVDTLLAASQSLSYLIYFVGGTDKDVQEFKVKVKFSKSKAQLIGMRPHEEMPLWQKAADVLVIPNTAKEDISKYYTSPMKLFEYMASGRPIVASDLPSLREVVDDSMVHFFEADNAFDLARKINLALREEELSEKKTQAAGRAVQNYSWEKRAKRIIEFLQCLS